MCLLRLRIEWLFGGPLWDLWHCSCLLIMRYPPSVRHIISAWVIYQFYATTPVNSQLTQCCSHGSVVGPSDTRDHDDTREVSPNQRLAEQQHTYPKIRSHVSNQVYYHLHVLWCAPQIIDNRYTRFDGASLRARTHTRTHTSEYKNAHA